MELEAGYSLCVQLWAWSGFLQNLEFFKLAQNPRDKILPTLLLMVYLSLMVYPSAELILLALVLHLQQLRQWRGIFNGGSDYMTTTVGLGLAVANLPSARAKMAGLLYISVQVVFSYVQAGLAKWRSRSWRQGTALVAYVGPHHGSAALRSLLRSPALSWLLMFWEISWVGVFIWPRWALVYILSGVLFHFGNAIFFRLNRFLWSWVAAYPALLVALKLLSQLK